MSRGLYGGAMGYDEINTVTAMDQIFLRDHIIELDIGAFAQERGAHQRIAFTVVVDVAPHTGAQGDDVDLILSYDTILSAIETEVANARVALLETLAEGIAGRVLGHAQACKIRVRIEKLDRVSGRLGVEIIRTEAPNVVEQGAKHDVSVICISSAMASGKLAKCADTYGGAKIAAVQGHTEFAPSDPTAGRRVELLAAEQAAWAGVGQIDGAVVVSSRTEMDYAIENAMTAFWAPSKMVFDAGEGVDAVPQDFRSLCGWLAQKIGATRLIYIDQERAEVPAFTGEIVDFGSEERS